MKAESVDECHDMAVVLPKWVLKLVFGSIDVARGPHFVVFATKDPGVVLLFLDYEDTRVPDEDCVDLGRSAFIRNDDVPEFEELETPRDRFEPMSWSVKPPPCTNRSSDEQDKRGNDDQQRFHVRLTLEGANRCVRGALLGVAPLRTGFATVPALREPTRMPRNALASPLDRSREPRVTGARETVHGAPGPYACGVSRPLS